MRNSFVVVMIAIAIASCQGSNKVATNVNSEQPQRKKMACADIHVDMNGPHIDWFEESDDVLKKADEIVVLPKSYKLYSVDTAKMHAFFNAIKQGEKINTVLPLPKPANCQLFAVTNNVIEGAPIPRGITLGLGESQGQKAALSYNGEQMTAHVDWFGLPYEIMPIKANNSTYYVVYTKEIKEPTTNPNNAKKADVKMVEYKPIK